MSIPKWYPHRWHSRIPQCLYQNLNGVVRESLSIYNNRIKAVINKTLCMIFPYRLDFAFDPFLALKVGFDDGVVWCNVFLL